MYKSQTNEVTQYIMDVDLMQYIRSMTLARYYTEFIFHEMPI